MSIRRLITFIAVADTGSFAEAAAQVHITPAAVSQQIHALEQELGIRLFDRDQRRSPELNKFGNALVPRARELIQSYNNLGVQLIDETKVTEELTIGAVGTTIVSLIPKLLLALKASYRNLHVRIVPGLSDELTLQVDRGTIDAAIISEPIAFYHHLLWRPFAEEPLMVITSKTICENQPEMLLESHPYIRFNRRAWVGQMIDEWLALKKLRVNETMELNTLESIYTMVHHNLGISIVPKRCVSSPTPFSLNRYPLRSPSLSRRLGLVSRHNPAKRLFLDIFYTELVNLVELNANVNAVRRAQKG